MVNGNSTNRGYLLFIIGVDSPKYNDIHKRVPRAVCSNALHGLLVVSLHCLCSNPIWGMWEGDWSSSDGFVRFPSFIHYLRMSLHHIRWPNFFSLSKALLRIGVAVKETINKNPNSPKDRGRRHATLQVKLQWYSKKKVFPRYSTFAMHFRTCYLTWTSSR